jgi:tRNA dimethylallyltransferase
MMNNKPYNLITVLGPTASGKTAFAANLAKLLDTEIISADSRQVYRGMDLGTGKDYADYFVDGVQVPAHLIDIVDAGEKYNVFSFQQDFLRVYTQLTQQGKIPVLCGGTGMYIEAVLNGYRLLQVPPDEDLRAKLETTETEELVARLKSYPVPLHNSTDLTHRKRLVRAIEIQEYYTLHPETDFSWPEIKPLIIGLKYERQAQREKITQRLKTRLSEGMIDEVKTLIDKGVPEDTLLYYGLEYKFMTLYLKGEITYNELFEQLNTAIHQFAKRQMTWFRHMEKNGTKIHWIDGQLNRNEKMEIAKEILAGIIIGE